MFTHSIRSDVQCVRTNWKKTGHKSSHCSLKRKIPPRIYCCLALTAWSSFWFTVGILCFRDYLQCRLYLYIPLLASRDRTHFCSSASSVWKVMFSVYQNSCVQGPDRPRSHKSFSSIHTQTYAPWILNIMLWKCTIPHFACRKQPCPLFSFKWSSLKFQFKYSLRLLQRGIYPQV